MSIWNVKSPKKPLYSEILNFVATFEITQKLVVFKNFIAYLKSVDNTKIYLKSKLI